MWKNKQHTSEWEHAHAEKKKHRVNAKTPQTCSATPTTTRKGNVQLCLSANPYHPFSRYGPSLSCNTVVLYVPGNFNNRKDVTPPLVYSRGLLNCELKVFLPQQIYLQLSECAIDGIIPKIEQSNRKVALKAAVTRPVNDAQSKSLRHSRSRREYSCSAESVR